MKKTILILATLLTATATNAEPPPATTQSAPFDQIVVIQADDASIIGRKRANITIYAPADTFEARAHTALNFAIAAADAYQLHSVIVFLLPTNTPALVGTGSQVARAQYSPDGGGSGGASPLKHTTWEVEAYTGKSDPLKDQVAALWWTHRDDYQKQDKYGSLTDEPALKAFIAKQLNIPAKQVRLPHYTFKTKHL